MKTTSISTDRQLYNMSVIFTHRHTSKHFRRKQYTIPRGLC